MSSPRIYDLPTRAFHWTFAGLFVAAYAIGSTVDDESPSTPNPTDPSQTPTPAVDWNNPPVPAAGYEI